MKTLFMACLILVVESITQSCNSTSESECPNYSYCNNDYQLCVCNAQYIGNCQSKANQIQSIPLAYNLTSGKLNLFIITPMTLDRHIQFQIRICQINSNVPLNIYFWVENGIIDEFNQNKTALTPVVVFFESSCQQIMVEGDFKKQNNGEIQLLIIGLELSNGTLQDINVLLKVNQRVPLELYFTQYFLLAVVVFLFVFFFIMMMILVLKKIHRYRHIRRIAQQSHVEVNNDNNIQFFDLYMKAAKAQKLGLANEACPVCLQNIQNSQYIRRTPCKHCFHNVCLDQWCKKNLTCPVCRTELNIEFLRAIKISQTMSSSNKDKYMKNWQQSNDIQLQNVQKYPSETGRDKQDIRQAML